jgi:hypothetical protein
MVLKLDKTIFNLILVILVTVAIQDVFIDQYSPYRIITKFTQFLCIIGGSIAFYRFVIKKYNYRISFNKWFLIFFILLFIYAVFSKRFFDLYPPVLYTLLPFFVFYNSAKNNEIPEFSIKAFTILIFIPGLILLYQSFFERSELYGDFFERADNVGYTLLGIVLLFSILKPSKVHLVLITLAFFATLLSLKRGAMISGSIIYFFYILNYRNQVLMKYNFFNLFVFFGIFFGSFFSLLLFSDVFLYRFFKDTGGSGRDQFYSLILKGWNESTLYRQLIGNGFFSTLDHLGNTYGAAIYAHSDWLEILYDFGLIGIIIFSCIFLSLFLVRKKVKKYCPHLFYPFLALLVVLFLKSLISGTYMTKFDSITYGVLGLILGQFAQNSILNRKL